MKKKQSFFARVCPSCMEDVKTKEDNSCCIIKDTDYFLLPSEVKFLKITSKNITWRFSIKLDSKLTFAILWTLNLHASLMSTHIQMTNSV